MEAGEERARVAEEEGEDTELRHRLVMALLHLAIALLSSRTRVATLAMPPHRLDTAGLKRLLLAVAEEEAAMVAAAEAAASEVEAEVAIQAT